MSIQKYIAERAELPNCNGVIAQTNTKTATFYTLQETWNIEKFAICPTCYEDYIAWTGLKDYFLRQPKTESVTGPLVCSTSIPFIRDTISRYSTLEDIAAEWEAFETWVQQRLAFPKCSELKNLPAKETWWFKAKNLPNLIICGACWLDEMGTDLAKHWDQMWLSEEEQDYIGTCDMGTIPVRMAWNYHKPSNDYPKFESLARMMLEHPRCDAKGITNGTWYTPRVYPGSQWAVCGRCVLAFTIPPGLFSEFEELPGPSDGSAYVCDLNPVKSRTISYLNKLDEAIIRKDFRIFSDYVTTYAHLPDCPRSNPTKNRKWYGNHDFAACELCYEEVVQGTVLAKELSCSVLAGEAICSLYSPRMRRLWSQACTENNLAGFGAFAKKRRNFFIYIRAREEAITLTQQIRRERMHTLMLCSTMNQGMDGFKIAMGLAGDGYQYGNDMIGWNYLTQEGAEAAAQFNEALGIQVVQTGDIAELVQLSHNWALVE